MGALFDGEAEGSILEGDGERNFGQLDRWHGREEENVGIGFGDGLVRGSMAECAGEEYCLRSSDVVELVSLVAAQVRADADTSQCPIHKDIVLRSACKA